MLVHPTIVTLISVCFALIVLMFLSKLLCFKQIVALDPKEEKKYFAAQYKRLRKDYEYRRKQLIHNLQNGCELLEVNREKLKFDIDRPQTSWPGTAVRSKRTRI